MKIRLTGMTTLPNRKLDFWQFVAFPTISLFYHNFESDRNFAINFEWLFWSGTIILYTDDQRAVYPIENI